MRELLGQMAVLEEKGVAAEEACRAARATASGMDAACTQLKGELESMAKEMAAREGKLVRPNSTMLPGGWSISSASSTQPIC